MSLRTMRAASGATDSPLHARRADWPHGRVTRQNDPVQTERGTIGRLPFFALGAGDPVLVIAGLMPYTGPGGDRMARAAIGSLAPLADRRRFVLVNRRPGLPRGMTMAEMAAEHADAIREGLGGRADVVGTSTGGTIAQQLAADHPDVVGRLELLSTACRLGPDAKELMRRVAARIRAGARRQATALFVSELAPPGPGQIVAAIVASVVGPLVLRDAQAFDDMATTIEAEDTFDLASCASPIAAPTLLVAGSDDRVAPPAIHEKMAKRIPGAKYALLEGCGHLGPMDQPEALNKALEQFLGTL
jgi:pimeloyl-ACP methyl ester carboxylesterase